MRAPEKRPPFFSTLGDFLGAYPGSTFIPAALLAQKAKSVSDGIVAALEGLSSEGDAENMGILRWLSALSSRVSGTPASDRLAAATHVAETGTTDILLARAILEDPVRSMPLGFYDWTASLRRLFVRDRLLQMALTERESAAIAAALSGDSALRLAYTTQLRRAARLTGGPRASVRSLEGRISGELQSSGDTSAHAAEKPRVDEVIFPSSYAVENGFPSLQAFFDAVRTGECDLGVTGESAFYAHQRLALKALLAPEKMPEAPARTISPEYAVALERLAGAAFFFARETHVKQLELAAPTASPSVSRTRAIRPGLTIEPVPSFYRLTADAFRFLREVVAGGWGEAALAARQLRADGAIARTIEEGIADVISLGDSAADLSTREIAGTIEPVMETLRANLAPLRADVDATGDARGLVPLAGVDDETGRARVVALIGWESHPLTVSVSHLRDLPPGTHLQPESHPIPVPLVRQLEVFPRDLRSRADFRRLCDSSIRR